MTNTISKQVFKAGMKRLEIAFMKNIPKDTIALYYEKLNNFDDDGFTGAVEYIIDNDKFFPTISRFKQNIGIGMDEYQPPIEDVLS